MKKVKKFLNYAASHQYAIVTYRTSDMLLAFHRDALYLIKTKEIIQEGRNLFLLDNNKNPRNNGVVLNIAQLTKMVMTLEA